MTSTLETQPAPRPPRPAPSGRCGVAIIGSGFAGLGMAHRPEAAAARTTSSSSSGPTTSAAPGGTTPIPAPPATCSPTSTRSPSRRTPTGRAPTPSSRRSRPTCRRPPTGSASASTASSAPTSPSARWDDAARRWQVRTTAGEFRAQVLVSAAGALADPTYPDIPGLDTFAGTVMHSARWDDSHDLAGERVAVIGTGASAIQVVPAIQPIVDSVAVYQRTPAWVVPRTDHPVKPLMRLLYRFVPGLQKARPLRALPVPRVPRHRHGQAPPLPQAGRASWPRRTCTARSATRSCARR